MCCFFTISSRSFPTKTGTKQQPAQRKRGTIACVRWTKSETPEQPTSITGGSCHKYHFCRNKSFVMTNTRSLRQTHVCRYKTHLLSRQKYACLNKSMFVMTILLLWQIFVATSLLLSHQTCLLSQQNTSFVATKVCLPQQNFCHDKNILLRQT